MSPTSYLITGTNKGIGLALVSVLAQSSPDAIIFASARDLSTATVLIALAAKYPFVHPVQMRSANVEDAEAVRKLIEEKVGTLNVVIANAGLCVLTHSVATVPIEDLVEHHQVNAVWPVVLYQIFLPLLLRSSNPKFVAVSTAAGSVSQALTNPLYVGAYGSSKAALNFLMLKIHQEQPGIVAFPLHPGMVDSDNGLIAKKILTDAGYGEFWVGMPPPESATAVLKLVADATREHSSGKFWNFDGTEIPW